MSPEIGMEEFPPLVVRAREAARQVGFPLTRDDAVKPGPSASLPGVGRFLAALAAACRGGRIAELGSGVGVGTAWMVSAMPPDCELITVEIDEVRASVTRELFAGDPRVEVVTGDAFAVLPQRAPFDLIFADGGGHADSAGNSDCGGQADGGSRSDHGGDANVDLVGLLRVGGHIVNDDITPQRALPSDSPYLRNDPKRGAFFGDSRLISVEVVLPDLQNSLLFGTRVD